MDAVAVATVAATAATIFTNVKSLILIVINIHKLLIMNNSYLTALALPFLHTSLNLSHMHAMAVTGNSGRSLPNQPHQPLTFPFPKREFGKKEASKCHVLVNGLGYIMLKMMLCCAILVLMLIQKKNFSGLLFLIWHLFQKVTTTGRMFLLSLIYILLANVTKKQLLK